MRVGAFLAVWMAFWVRVDAGNHFNVIFDVSRSLLNTTYNVIEVMERILNLLPPHIVRRHVPKSLTKELYMLINTETSKQVENKRILSGMIFRTAMPHIAPSALQDLSQVGELTDKIEKWAMRVYSPGITRIKRSWMLYDRDPRWYPDCIGRYRCKKLNDYDIYTGSRDIPWTYLTNSTLEPWLASNIHYKDAKKSQDIGDSCNSQAISHNTTVNAQRDSKSMLQNPYGSTSKRVRPRDFKVVYLN